jgi:DNA replication protein DnaC
MLTQPTLDQLKTLKLEVLAKAWLDQQQRADLLQLDFDERFSLLVDAQFMAQQNKRLDRALKEAKLKLSSACLEDIDYPAQRGLDRTLIRQMASGSWVQQHLNCVITGPTGVGKTYIGCALAQHACKKGYRALYRRAPRLFDELALARADGTYARLLARLARLDVLVLDDWGLSPIREPERRDFLEVLEDRYGTRSTVVTSQLPTDKWHDHLGDPTLADAICDRLLHNAYRIVLKGPSRRKEVLAGEKAGE